ncbi:hypothetical protein TNCV_2091771 [Trichonephila clavipes]|nr:hypothetical protein TNCV_2091771 [Trichonephila clavipes]
MGCFCDIYFEENHPIDVAWKLRGRLPAQMWFWLLEHGSKLRGPSPKALELPIKATLIFLYCKRIIREKRIIFYPFSKWMNTGSEDEFNLRTATAGSDVVQSGRPIFDDFFQHLWPYIGNPTANVVFQMVKRLWLIRIDQ